MTASRSPWSSPSASRLSPHLVLCNYYWNDLPPYLACEENCKVFQELCVKHIYSRSLGEVAQHKHTSVYRTSLMKQGRSTPPLVSSMYYERQPACQHHSSCSVYLYMTTQPILSIGGAGLHRFIWIYVSGLISYNPVLRVVYLSNLTTGLLIQLWPFCDIIVWVVYVRTPWDFM